MTFRFPRTWLRYVCWCALCILTLSTPERTQAELRFAVVGDYGVDAPEADEVAAMVLGWQPDFIVSVGDNNYGLTSAGHPDWDRLIGARYGSYILGREDAAWPAQTAPVQRFFPAVGNHDDDFHDGRAGFLDYFHDNPAGEMPRLPQGTGSVVADHVWYDFEVANAQFLILDSQYEFENPQTYSQQRIWFSEYVSDSTADWVFAFFHHAPYSSGYEANANLMPWANEYRGADAVFAGHDHLYEHVQRHETDFFVVGSSGQTLYPFKPESIGGSLVRWNESHGAMRVTIDAGEAHFEYHALDVGLVERYTIVKYLVPELLPGNGAWLVWLVSLIFLQHRGHTDSVEDVT